MRESTPTAPMNPDDSQRNVRPKGPAGPWNISVRTKTWAAAHNFLTLAERGPCSIKVPRGNAPPGAPVNVVLTMPDGNAITLVGEVLKITPGDGTTSAVSLMLTVPGALVAHAARGADAEAEQKADARPTAPFERDSLTPEPSAAPAALARPPAGSGIRPQAPSANAGDDDDFVPQRVNTNLDDEAPSDTSYVFVAKRRPKT